MIDIIFYRGTEIVLIRVQGHNIQFANSIYGSKLANIDGIKLDYKGVLKEFPDLKDNPDWNKEAIKRFKEKIIILDKEENISDYIIKDFIKFGYIPKFRQKAGFRRETLNGMA